MSDHDAKPDPMDEAYAQAEALLSDEAARAARRARALAAVAHEATLAPPASRAFPRRPALQRGGWLAAAGVAGLSVILATQLRPERPLQPPSAPMRPVTSSPAAQQGPQGSPAPRVAARHAAPPRAAPRTAAARTPPTSAASLAPAPRAFPAAPPVAAPPLPPPPADVPAPPPLPIPPAKADQPKYQSPAAPLAFPSPPSPADVVGASGEQTLGRSTASRPLNRAFSAPLPSDQAPRLFAAAAAGRTAEVKALLTRGVPVDAADADGNTALMVSIRADRPAVAAVLRRHGASLDLTNRAGVSARDMAMAQGDATLTRAIGLEP